MVEFCEIPYGISLFIDLMLRLIININSQESEDFGR